MLIVMHFGIFLRALAKLLTHLDHVIARTRIAAYVCHHWVSIRFVKCIVPNMY
jgi:hypothetical protein